jgi:hypothetical protein
MTSEPHTTTDRPTNNHLEGRGPEISEHAVQRYLQRIDAGEPTPRTRLRELLKTATFSGNHPDVSSGLAWVAGDAILVTDSNRETVVTVLRRRGQR